MRYKSKNRDRVTDFLKKNRDRSFPLTEICAAVAEDGHGKSTVYRIVSELVNEGNVKRISDTNSRHCTYQYVGGEACRSHLHLKCVGCGSIIHLDHTVSERLCHELAADYGFTPEAGGMLFGQCRACKERIV